MYNERKILYTTRGRLGRVNKTLTTVSNPKYTILAKNRKQTKTSKENTSNK